MKRMFVEANASGINPASSAQSYSCSLKATTGATYGAGSGSFEEAHERATGRELDRYTIRARANF